MNDWFDAEHHVERAHEHFEASRWDEAENELRRALALDPSRADWHFNLGLTLEAAGRIPAAVKAYDEARRLDPDNVQTLLALGVNRLRVEEMEGAVAALREAHRLAPSRPEPLVHLIDAQAALGQHEEAEVTFYMALQTPDVDEALAHLNMAGSLLDRGLYEKAIWCLREAAQIDPQLSNVHAMLAEAYAATGRRERARQLYLRELRKNPGDIDTLLDLGRLLVEMNRLGEAAEKFRRVLELQSDHADAHCHLGELALRLRRRGQALASFRVALRLDANHSGARRGAARIHLLEQDRDEARRLLRRELRAVEARPEEHGDAALDDLGGLLLDAGLNEEARRVLATLAERRPEDARAHHLLAVAAFHTGDRGAGIASCRNALRRDPRFLLAMHNLAFAYVEQKRWRRARVWVRRALEIEPDDSGLRRLRLRLRVQAVRDGLARVRERAGRRMSRRG